MKTHTIIGLTLACLTASLMTVSPAVAQEQRQKGTSIQNSPLIGKLETCTAITDNADRLACFDREVGALVGATNEGEVKVVQTEDIAQARRRLFGFSLPNIGLFGDASEDEITLLQSTITKVQQVGPKEWHIWIEEGNAQWQMKGTSIRTRAPKVGDPVEFKPATMGTYWIRVDGRNGVRGNRIG